MKNKLKSHLEWRPGYLVFMVRGCTDEKLEQLKKSALVADSAIYDIIMRNRK